MDTTLGSPATHSRVRRRILLVIVVAITALASFGYWRQRAHQQRIATALEELNEFTHVNVLWRVPNSMALYGQLSAELFGQPPDAYKKYSVILKPNQIDNAMVDRLIAVEVLDSIAIQGNNHTSVFRVSPVPLDKLPLAASPSAIDRLMRAYPDLFVYVDPVEEFE